MTSPPSALIFQWLATPLESSLRRQVEQLSVLPDAVHLAMMPDVHGGKPVPNGVVVATKHLIYPELVGWDIGCGISAIGFQGSTDQIQQPNLSQLLRQLPIAVPTFKHRTVVADQLRSPVENLGELSCDRIARQAQRDGRYQLGTLGRGNHFLELSRATTGQLWAVVHSGSRAMGQYITAHYLNTSAGESKASQLTALDLHTAEGQAYLSDMQWACRYATASRQAILNRVADLLEDIAGLQVDPTTFIDSPHNTATLQEHRGQQVIVHRKSANRASEGSLGLIAGSMLVGTKIVRGLGNSDSLESSSHGAGRVLSRKQAAESITARDLTSSMRAIVWNDSMAQRMVDESPQAYRDLHAVMAAQRDLVKTVDMLVPILNDKRP